MAAVGVPFHATISSSGMAHFPSQGGHGSSSSTDADRDPYSDLAAAASSTTTVFDLCDYIVFDQPELAPPSEAAAVSSVLHGGQNSNQLLGNLTSDNSDANASSPGMRGGTSGREEISRIAFRVKSEVEVIDDGFKWRKYGKKSVKNSPNPRNYFRCSTEGCSVKKRVEREREDPSYVITTYEGMHNHVSPGVVYYTTQDAVSGRFYVAGCSQPMPPPPS